MRVKHQGTLDVSNFAINEISLLTAGIEKSFEEKQLQEALNSHRTPG